MDRIFNAKLTPDKSIATFAFQENSVEDRKKAFIELHIAVFLFGFTAILGEVIEMPFLQLVWWRLLITSISLLFIAKISNVQKMSRISLVKQVYYGVIICIHWLAFYGSIQFSSASVALIGLATASFWASIIEPLRDQKPPGMIEMGLGLLIIPGMVLIAGSIEKGMWFGLFLGVVSAIFSALFSVLNRKVVKEYNAVDISLVELSGAFAFLSLFVGYFSKIEGYYGFFPNNKDWIYLIILSLLCTTLAYVLSLRSLKYLSAFTVTLTVNLEPIYGIILAFLLLGDTNGINLGFIGGGILIFIAVLGYPSIKRRFG